MVLVHQYIFNLFYSKACIWMCTCYQWNSRLCTTFFYFITQSTYTIIPKNTYLNKYSEKHVFSAVPAPSRILHYEERKVSGRRDRLQDPMQSYRSLLSHCTRTDNSAWEIAGTGYSAWDIARTDNSA